jgi:hypothetical protein
MLFIVRHTYVFAKACVAFFLPYFVVATPFTIRLPGLPDGLFSNQKYKFG